MIEMPKEMEDKIAAANEAELIAEIRRALVNLSYSEASPLYRALFRVMRKHGHMCLESSIFGRNLMSWRD